MHYLINALVEKSDILHNYSPWGGLEAYQRGVTVINYFW